MAGIKQALVIVALLVVGNIQAQITEGRIVFERKTNLLKKFGDADFAEMFKENKTKIDKFEMLFNDSSCVFKPIESEEEDQLAWTTNKNTIYQNLKTTERMSVLDLWGNSVFVKDTVKSKNWQITESRRNIANYECRKAIWQKDDTTRIYAWFSVDVIPSVGPELFSGLPGTILGLATEDGGIIYFATEVKAQSVPAEKLAYKVGKNEIYTVEKIRKELEERFASQPWGKRALIDLFRWF